MTSHTDAPDPRFTSRRERLFWAGAVAVVGLIAFTLFAGVELATLARQRDLVDGSFVVGLLLVGVAVVALAIGIRHRRWELGILLAVGAVVVLLVTRLALGPAERTHLIEYAALAALIYAALLERAHNGRGLPSPALLAIAITVSIGIVDECLQAVIPGRVFDPLDILFNATAAVTAVALGATVRWIVRRRAHQPRQNRPSAPR